ncbi:hypothetical protein [Bacteroides cellulosilyticus]|uniref:hypothetical protein n=1 Tax=Bacteroides cellulosilyticus TaxID=246787 RepID=UPI0029541342|nr:hypothetical protein [Bacteroides cellulosilyticus]MDV7049434.1 hypothetical protein [Bacteroides cellulosilyticus]
MIKQIRQTEKNDTPARVEYYGNPKAVTRMLVELIGKGSCATTVRIITRGSSVR